MNLCIYMEGAGVFNPFKGGVQRITRILKDEFEKKGYKVYLVTVSVSKINKHNSIYQENDVYILPSHIIDSKTNKSLLLDFIKSKEIDFFINQSPFSLKSARLSKHVRSETKTINVFHNCIECLVNHYSNFFNSGIRKYIGKISSKLGLWFLMKQLFILRSKNNWNYALKNSDSMVLYFNSFKKELETIYGISSQKIKLIPNPATYDPELNGETKINKKIIYVGRVQLAQKRFDRLLAVWERLHSLHPDWTFDVIGDGPFLLEAKEIVAKKNLNRITFHGMQDPKQYWKEADIFTMTSDFEGYGMVLIEAQALNTVPIAFRCYSAIDEVIHDKESGVIIDVFSIDLMVEEVSKLINDEARLINMKLEGQKQVHLFSRETITNKWIELFQEIK